MKTFRVIAVLFFAFAFVQISFSQGQTALPVLYLNPSPRLNGLGMVGVSFPNHDTYGFYYNPAQLGYISQTENLSYQLDPSNSHWMPPFCGPRIKILLLISDITLISCLTD